MQSDDKLHASWVAGHQKHAADNSRRIESALRCLRLIRDFVPMRSVVDFGCGIGAWLEAARQLGAEQILGIEGSWITEADTVIPKRQIVIHDLSDKWPNYEKSFDLALTIEVLEHLPETTADHAVEMLTCASNYVLFSAAIPKQGGIGHVNEQHLPYWVRKFWMREYVPLEPIRPFIVNDLTIYPWLRQNIVMFVSYSELLRNRNLIRFARPLDDFALRYIYK